ncbi:glucan biosynthesis protein D, partial [Leptospira biflexa]
KSPDSHQLGKTTSYYKGIDPLFPKEKMLTLYFTGDFLKALDAKTELKAIIKNDMIPADQIRYQIEKIRELDQWRLQIWHSSPIEVSNWKVHLEKENQKITETWIYRDGISK